MTNLFQNQYTKCTTICKALLPTRRNDCHRPEKAGRNKGAKESPPSWRRRAIYISFYGSPSYWQLLLGGDNDASGETSHLFRLSSSFLAQLSCQPISHCHDLKVNLDDVRAIGRIPGFANLVQITTASLAADIVSVSICGYPGRDPGFVPEDIERCGGATAPGQVDRLKAFDLVTKS